MVNNGGVAPLLKVPPASRGEPSGARVRFPLLAGGTCRREFGTHPPASRGEPSGARVRFPLISGRGSGSNSNRTYAVDSATPYLLS